jgi:hypothetical protein
MMLGGMLLASVAFIGGDGFGQNIIRHRGRSTSPADSGFRHAAICRIHWAGSLSAMR